MEKRNYYFFIVDANGAMTNTQIYFCNEKEKCEKFNNFKAGVESPGFQSRNPGSHASYLEDREILELAKRVKN